MITVSRAIRDKGYVSLKARKKILKASSDLGYSPNRAARLLRSSQSHEIAVIVESHDYLHVEKLAGIKQGTADLGYNLSIHFSDPDFPQSCLSYLSHEVLNQAPSGVVLIGNYEESEVQHLFKGYTNLIWVNTDPVLFCDCVYIDRQQGLKDGVSYLHQHGCHRIAHTPINNDFANKRLLGYREAIKEFNLPEILYYIPDISRYSLHAIYDFGIQLVGKLMEKDKADRPDGILTSDYEALGILTGCRRYGIKVPEELSVIGFDNREIAEYADPGLTSLAQPSREVGQVVAELLLQRLQDSSLELAPRNRKIPMKIMVRQSTK